MRLPCEADGFRYTKAVHKRVLLCLTISDLQHRTLDQALDLGTHPAYRLNQECVTHAVVRLLA